MKDTPITFSAEMVRATLEGRKTQTRRLLNHPERLELDDGDAPHSFHGPSCRSYCEWACGAIFDASGRPINHLHEPTSLTPFGGVGDRLWVRETWFPRSLGHWRYLDPHMRPHYRADPESDRPEWKGLWRKSIHMPRWASRLALEITDVRVERLQDIVDPRGEGVRCPTHDGPGTFCLSHSEAVCADHRAAFAEQWDVVNGTRAAWVSNPWVWVLSFKSIWVRP